MESEQPPRASFVQALELHFPDASAHAGIVGRERSAVGMHECAQDTMQLLSEIDADDLDAVQRLLTDSRRSALHAHELRDLLAARHPSFPPGHMALEAILREMIAASAFAAPALDHDLITLTAFVETVSWLRELAHLAIRLSADLVPRNPGYSSRTWFTQVLSMEHDATALLKALEILTDEEVYHIHQCFVLPNPHTDPCDANAVTTWALLRDCGILDRLFEKDSIPDLPLSESMSIKDFFRWLSHESRLLVSVGFPINLATITNSMGDLQIRTLSTENEHLSTRCLDLQDTNKSLLEMVDRMKEKIATFEQDRKLTQEQVEDEQSKMIQLYERQLKASKDAERSLREEKALLAEQIKLLQDKNTQSDNLLRSTQDQAKRLNEEVSHLRSQVSKKAELDQQVKQLEQEKREMEKQIGSYEATLSTLKSRLADVEKKAELNRTSSSGNLSASLSTSSSSVTSAPSRIASVSQSSAATPPLRSQSMISAPFMQEEINTLRKKLASETEDSARMKKTIADLEARVAAQEAEKDQEKNLRTVLRRSLKTLESELQETRRQLEVQTSMKDNLQRIHSETIEQRSRLLREVEVLRRQLIQQSQNQDGNRSMDQESISSGSCGPVLTQSSGGSSSQSIPNRGLRRTDNPLTDMSTESPQSDSRRRSRGSQPSQADPSGRRTPSSAQTSGKKQGNTGSGGRDLWGRAPTNLGPGAYDVAIPSSGPAITIAAPTRKQQNTIGRDLWAQSGTSLGPGEYDYEVNNAHTPAVKIIPPKSKTVASNRDSWISGSSYGHVAPPSVQSPNSSNSSNAAAAAAFKIRPITPTRTKK